LTKRALFGVAALLFVAACDNGEPAADTPADKPSAAAPAADSAVDPNDLQPIIEVRALNEWYRAVLIDERAITDPLELETIGRQICEGLAPCRAAMWFDAADAPTEYPVREIQIRYQVFAFGRTMSGDENILWNCDVFPEFEAERRCLPRPLN
jgi:hypothetical protein